MRRVKDFGVPEESPNGRKYFVRNKGNGKPNVVRAVEMIDPQDVQLPEGQHYRPTMNVYKTVKHGDASLTRIIPIEKAFKDDDFEWENMTKMGNVAVHNTFIPSANFQMPFCEKLPDLNIKIINTIEVRSRKIRNKK